MMGESWEWRKANTVDRSTMTREEQAAGQAFFHAVDPETAKLACSDLFLMMSVEAPNEGSDFCLRCLELAGLISAP